MAYAAEVKNTPVAATLLSEAVVVWRTADGRAHAMRWGGDKGMVYFFASQPETVERCRGLPAGHAGAAAGGRDWRYAIRTGAGRILALS